MAEATATLWYRDFSNCRHSTMELADVDSTYLCLLKVQCAQRNSKAGKKESLYPHLGMAATCFVLLARQQGQRQRGPPSLLIHGTVGP